MMTEFAMGLNELLDEHKAVVSAVFEFQFFRKSTVFLHPIQICWRMVQEKGINSLNSFKFTKGIYSLHIF